jgi:iron complex transport system permease protein
VPGPANAVTRPRHRPNVSLVAALPLLAVMLIAVIGVSAAFGSVNVGLESVARVIGHHVFGLPASGSSFAVDDQIVWQLRLPEVLLAAVVGAGLAVVGATLQATVRNPLADPYLLGVSSGAGLLAAAVITLGSAAVAGLSTSAAAFAGALLSTVLVLGISAGSGSRFAPARVVLAGVTLSFLFLGLTNYLIFHSNNPNAADSVLFWLLGSLSNVTWTNLLPAAAALAVGAGYLLTHCRALNALTVGDETALSVGVNVRALRVRLLIVTSLITGVMVAVAGGVSFVGLIIPHVVRLVVGPDHRKVLPVTALAGAVFLVLVDLICRVATSPQVLPLSIVTSVVGAPVFLWLLRRSRSGAMAR